MATDHMTKIIFRTLSALGCVFFLFGVVTAIGGKNIWDANGMFNLKVVILSLITLMTAILVGGFHKEISRSRSGSGS